MKIVQALHCFGSCVYYLTQLIIILQTSKMNELLALGIHYISGIPLLHRPFSPDVLFFVFGMSSWLIDWLYIVWCSTQVSFIINWYNNFWWRSVGFRPSFWPYNPWAGEDRAYRHTGPRVSRPHLVDRPIDCCSLVLYNKQGVPSILINFPTSNILHTLNFFRFR